MNKNMLTTVLAFLLCAFLMVKPFPVLADGENAVVTDVVQIVNLGQKTIANAGVIEAYRTGDESQADSISFFNQSTIAKKQSSGKYYRTIAYEIALADVNQNPLTEYKKYEYDPYRIKYMEFMQKYISDNNLSFGKPYASEEILNRKYLLQFFLPRNLIQQNTWT